MNKILFFDGMCNLCNGFVDLLISHGFSGKFAAMQGQTAKLHLSQEIRDELGSVVYMKDGLFLEKTPAIRAALMDSSGGLRILGRILGLLPDSCTNWVYDLVAKNRYKIFGKRESCRLPTDKEREKFLA